MLTSEQRGELDAVMRKRHGNAALARRARCVLLWSEGERRVDIRGKLACNDEFVSKWTSAFETQGLAGLVSLHPGRAPKVPVAKLDARVLDAADGAALDASDALDSGSAYSGGLRSAVEISDASVRQAASQYLAVQPRPLGVTLWVLADGTGSPDGQTAVIRLRGTADIPIAASVLSAFGGFVNITVESRARSGLR